MEFMLWNMFGLLGVFTSWMVISANNVVHSVLYLVLVFCNVTGVLLMMEMEFVGLMLMMVYVGAVAVLFLFIVMMVGGDIESKNNNNSSMYVLLLGIVVLMLNSSSVGSELENDKLSLLNNLDEVSSVSSMGEVLYTMYMYHVLVGGFVLLMAMIGGMLLGLCGSVKEE